MLTAIDEYGSWIFSESKFEFIPEPPLGTLTTLESAEIVPSLVLVLTVIKIGGSSAKSASLNNTWSAEKYSWKFYAFKMNNYSLIKITCSRRYLGNVSTISKYQIRMNCCSRRRSGLRNYWLPGNKKCSWLRSNFYLDVAGRVWQAD